MSHVLFFLMFPREVTVSNCVSVIKCTASSVWIFRKEVLIYAIPGQNNFTACGCQMAFMNKIFLPSLLPSLKRGRVRLPGPLQTKVFIGLTFEWVFLLCIYCTLSSIQLKLTSYPCSLDQILGLVTPGCIFVAILYMFCLLGSMWREVKYEIKFLSF